MVTRIIPSSLLLLALVSYAPAAQPQRRGKPDQRGSMVLDELARRPEAHTAPSTRREVYDPERTFRPRPNADAHLNLPREAALPAAPAPLAVAPVYTGFQALLDNYSSIPPDTNGAVGPYDVVTMLNTQVLIQSRDGTYRNNYPVNIGGRGGFWSQITTTSDVFDPNIRYDQASDRWVASAAMNSQISTSALLVAVSATGDPGGSWYMYKININANVSSVSFNWADYPVLGVNGNWVAVSVNLFNQKDNYVNTELFVFSKADLYKNGQGTYVSFTDNAGEFIPAVDYDNKPNTMYFVRTYAGDVGVHNNAATIEVSTLTGPVGSEKFAAGLDTGSEIVFSDTWADTGADGADFLPQAGSTKMIDAGDSRLQNCVLRGGSIWCAHTVFLPLSRPTRSAVQWFQIDPVTPKILQRGRIDDAKAQYFYAYPSIAVNANNDVLIGYNRFSSGDYPSAEFSYRLSTDPPNTLEPDTLFEAGQSSYVASGFHTPNNRWGDYSRTWVDPADDLTFWTLQEYAVVPSRGTSGQFATWWAQVVAPSVVLANPPVFTSQAVVSAASYQGGGVAPGELVTLFGSNLGPAALAKPYVSTGGVVDTTAGGTRVFFDGVPATMIFSSAKQVAAVAPFGLAGKATTTITVSYFGNTSTAVTVPVISNLPGIFTADSSGQGEAALLNQDQSVNTIQNPAVRGSVLTIYATGAGAMPGVLEGTLAGPPYVQIPATQVSARVGGQPASINYAGVAPGIVVGVIQINIVIPNNITPGSAVPLDITIGGVTSKPGVTVAVN